MAFRLTAWRPWRRPAGGDHISVGDVADSEAVAIGPGAVARVDRRSGGVYVEGGKMVAATAAIVGVLAYAFWRVNQPGCELRQYNIAVVPFGQVDARGQVAPWPEGATLSRGTFATLRDEIGADKAFKDVVGVCYHDVQPIGETDPVKRGERAGQLAQQLHANLLIYGNLTRQSAGEAFAPEFYVDVKELRGGEELVGAGKIGRPVAFVLSGLGGMPTQGEVAARTQALVKFAAGLVYLQVKQYDLAAQLFTQAAQVPGWNEDDGKEVPHLFAGTAFKLRNGPGDLDRARQEYQTAAAIDQQYARAYVGLGLVAYQQYVRATPDQEMKYLDESRSWFDRAERATEKPAAGYVDEKVAVTIGIVDVEKAQRVSSAAEREALLAEAEQKFAELIREHEQKKDDATLTGITSNAYRGLGTIQELRGRADEAVNSYQQAIATAADHPDVRDYAQARIAEIQRQRGAAG